MLLQVDLAKGLPLNSRSVHCCITSPPYWSQRQYAIFPSIWGGQPNCSHAWIFGLKRGVSGGVGSTMNMTHGLDNFQSVPDSQHALCSECGAWQGQLGLEPSMSLFISHLVESFEEVKRVLRDDGVLWVNMGDSFVGSGGPGSQYDGKSSGKFKANFPKFDNPSREVEGLPALNKMLIPHRFAIAMQEAGWLLRQDIVWSKGQSLCPAWSGSVMPESVSSWRWERHRIRISPGGKGKSAREIALGRQDRNGGENVSPAVWADCPGCVQCKPHNGLILHKGSWRPTSAHEYIFMFVKTDKYYADIEAVQEALACPEAKDVKFGGNRQVGKAFSGNMYSAEARSGRNLRSVWAPQRPGYRGEHYAVYPAPLVEPMVKASTSSRGCCPSCGSQWARVKGTQEFLPTCDCPPRSPIPTVILDPFGGSGTTGMVAQSLGRRWICMDLGWDYLLQAKERTGMNAIEEWQSGVVDNSNLSDLPMFNAI